MRVGFAGTPQFAALALEAILAAGFKIPLVLTQPDRPKGRGLRQESSPVKQLAQSRGLPVQEPATLKTDAAREPLLAVPLDVLVVAAYGLILPPAVLSWPRHGCINIHASLLPRWRGAAPIQRAIAAGVDVKCVLLFKIV
jgi:methionyl-tRNA formyltransferase